MTIATAKFHYRPAVHSMILDLPRDTEGASPNHPITINDKELYTFTNSSSESKVGVITPHIIQFTTDVNTAEAIKAPPTAPLDAIPPTIGPRADHSTQSHPSSKPLSSGLDIILGFMHDSETDTDGSSSGSSSSSGGGGGGSESDGDAKTRVND